MHPLLIGFNHTREDHTSSRFPTLEFSQICDSLHWSSVFQRTNIPNFKLFLLSTKLSHTYFYQNLNNTHSTRITYVWIKVFETTRILFVKFFTNILTCIHFCGVWSYAALHLGRYKDSMQELFLSCYHTDPEDRTQFIKLACKHLDPLSHLGGPKRGLLSSVI